MTGIEQWLLPKLGVKAPPWTLHRDQARPRVPEAGGRVPADRLSRSPTASSPSTACQSVFISNTNHDEDQPAHLTLKDAERSGAGQPGEVRRPREPLLPGRRLRVRRRRRRQRRGCRSTRRTACTARPATSRTRRRTSSGSRPKAAAGRTTSACDGRGAWSAAPSTRRALQAWLQAHRCPSGVARDAMRPPTSIPYSSSLSSRSRRARSTSAASPPTLLGRGRR